MIQYTCLCQLADASECVVWTYLVPHNVVAGREIKKSKYLLLDCGCIDVTISKQLLNFSNYNEEKHQDYLRYVGVRPEVVMMVSLKYSEY